MKSLMKIAALSMLTLASATRMMAQAEVNPDHFPDEATPAVTVPANIQAEIEQQRAFVASYETQLRMKSGVVEESRNEAISAGLQGDGAAMFIDAYRANQEQFDALRESLNPRITMALNTIASLEAGSTVVAEATRVTGPTSTVAPAFMESSRNMRRVSTRPRS
jgi:hypothetical protein